MSTEARKVGRPADPRRAAVILKYGLTGNHRSDRGISAHMLNQLDACQSEEARRILLGVSEKVTA